MSISSRIETVFLTGSATFQESSKANETNPDLPVIAYLLEHNTASAQVAQRIGLTLEDRCSDAGNPDPEAVRLIYSTAL